MTVIAGSSVRHRNLAPMFFKERSKKMIYNANPSRKQTVRPPDRPEMIKNEAGGYGWKMDDLAIVKRWLLTGSMGNFFYQTEEKITDLNLEVFHRIHPVKLKELIVEASKEGLNNHTPILALTHLSKMDSGAFKDIFQIVIRTASHLYEFLNYVKELRGFGRSIHKAVKNWLKEMDVDRAAYQFLKYQSRYGWSVKDVLRKFKPVESTEKSVLYGYFTGKQKAEHRSCVLYEALKKGTVENIPEVIRTQGLTHEMIPANVKRTREVWEALFEKMPIVATIRNLGQLTAKGLFNSKANIEILRERIEGGTDKVHPIALASAYKIYSSGGLLGRSLLTWHPSEPILDILEKSIENSFFKIKDQGLNILHGIDVSGSMEGSLVQPLWLSASQVAVVMVLATLKSQRYYTLIGFDTESHQLPFSKAISFYQAMEMNFSGGGTDCTVPIKYAIKRQLKDIDAIVIWSDGDTWAGEMHVYQAFEQYKRINPKAKLIIVNICNPGNMASLSDPKNPDMYDIAGFTANTPKLVEMIIKGDC